MAILYLYRGLGDHPRLRGEQTCARGDFHRHLGSPPLARGTVQLLPWCLQASGITPACAGNSNVGRRGTGPRRDHPRLRGEQLRRTHFSMSTRGSPPLARGTDAKITSGSKSHGITPACAGNSNARRGKDASAQDHPRLRGEQPFFCRGFGRGLGSPPLARGTVETAVTGVYKTGITPACAGNSSSGSISRGIFRDHPRLRGEQCKYCACISAGLGSPPLARGTGDDRLSDAAARGITPACAGNRHMRRYTEYPA